MEVCVKLVIYKDYTEMHGQQNIKNVYICRCVCVRARARVYIYIYVCVCVYIYIHAHARTHTQVYTQHVHRNVTQILHYLF